MTLSTSPNLSGLSFLERENKIQVSRFALKLKCVMLISTYYTLILFFPPNLLETSNNPSNNKINSRKSAGPRLGRWGPAIYGRRASNRRRKDHGAWKISSQLQQTTPDIRPGRLSRRGRRRSAAITLVTPSSGPPFPRLHFRSGLCVIAWRLAVGFREEPSGGCGPGWREVEGTCRTPEFSVPSCTQGST